MKFLTSGKVKDVYELEDSKLLFKFSDRVSAYDVKFKDEIPRKGEILCKFAEYWFKKLDVPNHFVERKSNTEIIVKKNGYASNRMRCSWLFLWWFIF